MTGLDGEGRSCIISDGPSDVVLRFPDDPDPKGDWSQIHWMWSTESVPVVPHQDPSAVQLPPKWFPGPGGSRLIIETLSPRFGVDPAPEAAPEGSTEGTESIFDFFNSRYRDGSGVHSSDTIDYAIVISGRLWLQMTNGDEVELQAGDCVVQTGVRHTWRNRGEEPCQVAFIMIGAERAADPEAER